MTLGPIEKENRVFFASGSSEERLDWGVGGRAGGVWGMGVSWGMGLATQQSLHEPQAWKAAETVNNPPEDVLVTSELKEC